MSECRFVVSKLLDEIRGLSDRPLLVIVEGEEILPGRRLKISNESRDKRAERDRLSPARISDVFQADPVLDQWQLFPAGMGVDNALYVRIM